MRPRYSGKTLSLVKLVEWAVVFCTDMKVHEFWLSWSFPSARRESIVQVYTHPLLRPLWYCVTPPRLISLIHSLAFLLTISSKV